MVGLAEGAVRDPRGGYPEPGRPESGRNALARLTHRALGQANHDEGGYAAAGKIHLYIHPIRIHAIQGAAGQPRYHSEPSPTL